MSKEPDYCPQCGEEIDVTTCQCGDAITEDRAHADDHSAVPMGCACHYEDHAAQSTTLRIRWAEARKRILVLEAGAAFHNVTVRQRNSAVDEAERLTAERDRLAGEVERLSEYRNAAEAYFSRFGTPLVDCPVMRELDRVRAAPQAPVVGAHGANPVSLGDVWVGETKPQLPVPDGVHEHGWQWRPVGAGAFAPPFGTIRVCTGCGCLVAGGPTCCGRCATKPAPSSASEGSE